MPIKIWRNIYKELQWRCTLTGTICVKMQENLSRKIKYEIILGNYSKETICRNIENNSRDSLVAKE